MTKSLGESESESGEQETWGIIKRAARHLGIPDATYRMWVSRRYVPATVQLKIVKAALCLGFTLDQSAIEAQRELVLNKKTTASRR